MKNRFPLFGVLILWCLNMMLLHGQGCSDAGFCTIDGFKPSHGDSIQVLKNQFKVGTFYGNADNAIAVYGSYVEYSVRLSKTFGIDTKLTTLAQNGNDISVFGLSDLFINSNYAASEKLKFTFGTKIPLSNANRTQNNLPLPMDYQASLGTFDLIMGVGYQIGKMQWVVAIQQPLTQNENQFLASNFPTDSKLSTFQSTRNFERSGDVLLRVSYPIKVSSKLNLTPSVLPIYHLANDKFTDELNIKREIEGSKGLTLNLNLFLDYQVSNHSFIQLNMGIPAIVRDVRPDGLTRSFIANLEYRIKF
jgi:hypothetical protein